MNDFIKSKEIVGVPVQSPHTMDAILFRDVNKCNCRLSIMPNTQQRMIQKVNGFVRTVVTICNVMFTN